MKRKDLEVGKTYRAEDRSGQYEVIPLTLDPGEAWRVAGVDGLNLRWRQQQALRDGKTVLVAFRPFYVSQGEVSRTRVSHWGDSDVLEWGLKTVILAQIKESFDWDEFSLKIKEEHKASQILFRERKAGAEERRVVLQGMVEKANATLGAEVFNLGNYGRWDVPSWQVSYKHEASVLLKEVLGEEQ